MKNINIKGLEHFLISEDGKIIINSKTGKQVTSFLYRNETTKINPQHEKYRAYIALWNVKERKVKLWTVARLVYVTYCGGLKNGMEIDHIDNDQSNDHYSNLQQISRRANALKIYKDNKKYFDDRRRKIEEQRKKRQQEIIESHKIICKETGKIYKNMVDAASDFKVTKMAICKAVNNGHALKKKFHFFKKIS